MDSRTCQSENVWSIPNKWVFQTSAFSENHVFHESTELGVSPMAKKGASQLRSTCVLRNSAIKVIKKMVGASRSCLRFRALEASIHHSLYGQQTDYEWRDMVQWPAPWVAENSAAFHKKFGLRIPTCPKDNRVVTNTLATQRTELNLSP